MNVNPKQIKTAQRYASALTKFDNRESLLGELALVSSTLSSSKDLSEFLQNPIVTNADKKEVLNKVFADFSDDTKNFLMVLVEKNRFGYFDSILSLFKTELDEIKNVKRVSVVSAVALTEEEKTHLQHKLQLKLSCDVVLEYAIDESIIAGLVIKIGDKIIDNSVRAQLYGLKKQLI